MATKKTVSKAAPKMSDYQSFLIELVKDGIDFTTKGYTMDTDRKAVSYRDPETGRIETKVFQSGEAVPNLPPRLTGAGA